MILKQIGVVKHKYNDDEVRKSINGVDAVIEIFPEYEEGLKGIDGVWASLNFHEFVSNSQPLGFNRVTGQSPVHTPPPL